MLHSSDSVSASVVTKLSGSNIEASVKFYTNILGFVVDGKAAEEMIDIISVSAVNNPLDYSHISAMDQVYNAFLCKPVAGQGSTVIYSKDGPTV